MKKIIIACDSFKGCLTSAEVAQQVEEGIRAVFPDAEVIRMEIADGGEGTLAALTRNLPVVMRTIPVYNPLMEKIEATYAIESNGKTAYIEMATASGLTLIAPEKRNPLISNTYGTGELIKDALLQGCRNFVIGIGGSATNDAGLGMLQALGYRFFDHEGEIIDFCCGKILSDVCKIDSGCRLAALDQSTFSIACDVDNPFSGTNGAAYVYAPQKGASPQMVEQLDRGLSHLSTLIRRCYAIDLEEIPGTGAAGGLGGAFVAFLGAGLKPGIELILESAGLESFLLGADLVITGEGKLDKQTARGKAPAGILRAAHHRQVPVIAIGGAIEDRELLDKMGFDAVFPISNQILSPAEAMRPVIAKENIRHTIERIMNNIREKLPTDRLDSIQEE